MRKRLLALLASVGVAVAVALPGAARANPFPNNYDSAVADSFIHTFCLTTTFTVDPTIATYAMDVLDLTTDMIDSDYGACTDFTADVWWWQQDLPGTLRGERSCYFHSSPGVCDSSDVKLDIAQLDTGTADDWTDRRKTSVHELGHSIGLGHDTISAMVSGEVPSTALQWRRYSAHDLGHINAQY
jgi:hypothetical protein